MNDTARIPDEDAARLNELAATLIVKLLALVRTARTHDITNQLFVRQEREFAALLHGALEEEDELALFAVGEYVYLNGVRLRAQSGLLPSQHALIAELERRQLGGIRFLSGVTEAEVERFFQLFLAAEDASLAERLVQMCKEASIEYIEPIPASEMKEDDLARRLGQDLEVTGERTRAKKVFWRAVMGTKRIMLRARQTGRADLRHAKRLVQPIVDSVMKHEHSIVGLTAIKEHDEYTFAHCVNVSVLSVSMGHQLGLDRQALADLGVAGLLHDLGKLAVPATVLQKPAALSADEWVLMKRHPIEGAKMLTRLPGLSALTLDAMRVAFEHHMNRDRTGYPEVGMEWSQSSLSRVVAVADCFDAMTAHRAYHKRALSSFEALGILLGTARVQFDPATLWALLRTVGLYPPGTALVLDSGHIVLSLTPNPDTPRRPSVRIVLRPDGSLASQDQPEDWCPMPEDRRVDRVLPPEELNADATEYLAA